MALKAIELLRAEFRIRIRFLGKFPIGLKSSVFSETLIALYQERERIKDLTLWAMGAFEPRSQKVLREGKTKFFDLFS